MLLGQANVAGAVEDALEADPAFDPRQRSTRAGVHAASEREVRADRVSLDAELRGALELAWVAVGCAVEQHHRRTGGNLDVTDFRAAPGQPEVRLHGALDAERFFDELRDQ